MKRFFPLRFLGGARSWQAVLEAIAGYLVFLLLLLRLTPMMTPEALEFGLLVLNPVWALWCALRIRFIAATKLTKALREAILIAAIEMGFLFCVGLPVLIAGGSAIAVWRDIHEGMPYGLLLVSVFTIGPAYAVCRAGVWVVRFWTRFQRRSMVLSLTNSILSLVLAAGVFFQMAVIAVVMLANPSNPFPGEISGLAIWFSNALSLALSLFFGSSLLILCGLGMLLPFAAVFSFWVARRTTRRLTELAGAADSMRAGRYDTRVPVQGEDEMARLQSGFNAMAANLERTLRDLRTEKDRVQGLLESRKELVVGISHDLRTPVATLRALLESQRREGRVPNAEQSRLDTMEREVIRLQGLIDELFQVSQAEVDRLTIDPQPTQVGEIVRQRVAAAAPLAWQSGRVRVSAEIPADLPPAVADTVRLEQVLANLLHNAVRHTPPGGLVMATVSAEDRSLRIDIRDTGAGIDAEDLPRIWERYYRGRHEAEDDGAGIGLALVREYTVAMGGRVSVESEPGRGSIFSIFLPVVGSSHSP